MSVFEYLLRRLALAVFVVLGVLLMTFLVSRVVPGDPARLYVGARASPEALERARAELGLDDPLPQQFLRYVVSSARGEFGYSFRTKRPILEDLKVRVPATMELVVLAMALAIAVGVPVGVLAAANFGGPVDRFVRVVSIAGVSMPAFWLALLLQLVFFLWLGVLPLGGRISQTVSLMAPITQITGFHLIDAALTGNWVAWRNAAWHVILAGRGARHLPHKPGGAHDPSVDARRAVRDLHRRGEGGGAQRSGDFVQARAQERGGAHVDGAGADLRLLDHRRGSRRDHLQMARARQLHAGGDPERRRPGAVRGHPGRDRHLHRRHLFVDLLQAGLDPRIRIGAGGES